MDVGAWLREPGLGEYEQAFRDNHIDAALLPELTANDLTGLGIVSVPTEASARRHCRPALEVGWSKRRSGEGIGGDLSDSPAA